MCKGCVCSGCTCIQDVSVYFRSRDRNFPDNQLVKPTVLENYAALVFREGICVVSLLFNQNENLQEYDCHFCFRKYGQA